MSRSNRFLWRINGYIPKWWMIMTIKSSQSGFLCHFSGLDYFLLLNLRILIKDFAIKLLLIISWIVGLLPVFLLSFVQTDSPRLYQRLIGLLRLIFFFKKINFIFLSIYLTTTPINWVTISKLRINSFTDIINAIWIFLYIIFLTLIKSNFLYFPKILLFFKL